MLEYPFDSGLILRKKKSLAAVLRAKNPTLKTRIAILGGSTTNHIADVLELFLLDWGIAPVLYQCEYGQYYQEVLYNNSALKAFAPDFIYLHTTRHNIARWPVMADSPAQVEALLDAQYSQFAAIWEKITTDYPGCTIIQNNFDLPEYRLLGNREAFDHRGRVRFVRRLNERFADYAAAHSSFFLCDINYLSAVAGLDNWNDPTAWHMYKYAPAPAAIPPLCHDVAAIIKSALGRNKKALALDLDNTLWGGVVGDDGVEGIEIGSETPSGQVYKQFQSYVKELKSMGILLTVNSKNDMENALAGLRHPSSMLSPEDFLIIKANWMNKDKNLLETANALNILPDSFVFVDDNPVERGIVTALDAGVSVPEIGQPEDYIRVLDRSGFFETTGFTEDDLHRSQMYEENAQRTILETQAGSYSDYLLSLAMVAHIRPFEALWLPRISQLTNKSNQFNLTTRRYTTAEITEAMETPTTITLYGALADRFGDNGVVSVVIGELLGDTLDIVLWLMSCRVLKRGMEQAMLDALAAHAVSCGAKTLRGHYYPSAKNVMVRDFYTDMGFTLIERRPDGTGLWELPLNNYQNQNDMIQVNEQ